MRPQIEEAIDRLRSALADSPACNWETLTDETGLSPSTLRPILQRLPENDWALRAFRSRRRAWQLQLRKEREKELAARLEKHLREGGSFKSFAKKEGISRSKASGVYYRNLEHLEYKEPRDRAERVTAKSENRTPGERAQADDSPNWSRWANWSSAGVDRGRRLPD